MDLFIAVTLYNDKIYGKCSSSILNNCLSLMRNGHTVMPHYNSDLYIDRSRNLCVKLFLDSNCSDIIFVDSDLGFDDEAIPKLIKYDKDIVAGAYRYKKSAVEYVVDIDFSRNNNCKEEETGLIYVTKAPTGLMRIKRDVFTRMIEYYNMEPDEREIYPFFDTGMRFENDNNWWGEDAYFVKRWIDMGETVMAEPRITFTHIGNEEFTGNLHEYLMGRRVQNMDSVENGIRGWMSDLEIGVLNTLASQCEDVVEIGCWKGRSTKELLESCKGKVYAVDHWGGSKNDLTELAAVGLDVYDKFMQNVGEYENLEVLQGESKDIADKFLGKADMVFIDAGHEYEECKSDIEAWLPKCNKFLCGHDYSDDFPGVMKAVNEIFEDIKVKGSIWIVEV